MGNIEKSVFLSYRRASVPWALAIFKDLTPYGYDVFIDYDGLPSGDFARAILENIETRAHFIVLVTPSALEGCVNADDWLRREIEHALRTKRNIVPALLEGADFRVPALAEQLKGSLAPLQRTTL